MHVSSNYTDTALLIANTVNLRSNRIIFMKPVRAVQMLCGDPFLLYPDI